MHNPAFEPSCYSSIFVLAFNTSLVCNISTYYIAKILRVFWLVPERSGSRVLPIGITGYVEDLRVNVTGRAKSIVSTYTVLSRFRKNTI